MHGPGQPEPLLCGRVARRLRRGLRLLLQAHEYARELQRDQWDFAVEITSLREAGFSNNDCRWLVCKGVVDHAVDVTDLDADAREFKRGGKLNFSEQTSFVLTNSGLALAHRICAARAASSVERDVSPAGKNSNAARDKTKHAGNGHAPVTPCWDGERHELRVGCQLVKVFRLPSPNQETILMAFEEDEWPPRIDDPLPQHPDLLPKRRLHDAIKSLNRNQKARAIRFMGDGTGEGIRWELIFSYKDNGTGR